MYEYQATVTRVVDGDTLHARVDLGCDVRIDLTIRLYGINAPELSTPEGKAVRDWLTGRLGVGTIILRTVKDKREKYGRYLGTIYTASQAESVNDEMLRLGLARIYLP